PLAAEMGPKNPKIKSFLTHGSGAFLPSYFRDFRPQRAVSVRRSGLALGPASQREQPPAKVLALLLKQRPHCGGKGIPPRLGEIDQRAALRPDLASGSFLFLIMQLALKIHRLVHRGCGSTFKIFGPGVERWAVNKDGARYVEVAGEAMERMELV